MTVAQIKIHLETINHSKESRKANVQMVVANPQMISTLLKTAQNVNEQISCKALWLLEFVCREDLKQITPFLDEFIETIQLVKLESAKRPSAKICEYLIENYYCKSQLLEVYSLLNVRIRSKIAEQCFDWLIDEKTKVATKAYSMTSLFLLGQNFHGFTQSYSYI